MHDATPQERIRVRIKRLTADWLADQADNGWDGQVEYLLDDIEWTDEAFDLIESEARALAAQIVALDNKP